MSFLLQHWVAEQASRRPEAIALVLGDERLTYGELEAAGNRLGRLLRAEGCRRGDRVCLLIPKSPMAIVAMLGALKADAVYVPLDTASPAARLARVVEAADARWLLAAGPVEPVLDQLFAAPDFGASHTLGWLSEEPCRTTIGPRWTAADLGAYASTPPAYRNTSRDPAQILFTSGSTGAPKGVVITHESVTHFIRWAVRYFATTPSDRVSGHPPLHFDLSTFDVFGTFAVGAELHLVPPELNLLPHKLAQLIRGSRLTQWFSVPSALNYMAKFDVVRPGDFPTLERLLWCGEVLPTPTLMYLMDRLPHVTFTNLYGPTETTIASSYHTVPSCPTSGTEPIPIGRPCDGEELLVLDQDLQPLAPGEVGDLYIAGVGLSPGYWRDPETTRAAFVPRPGRGDGERIYRTGDLAKIGSDGLVYFLGRRDTQIKTRGYRVELGEVESALHALGLLRECAAVGVASGGFEGTVICCAYALRAGTALEPGELRRLLATSLPAYMLPARWLAVEELPKNANGKIDRRRIRELFELTPAGLAP